MGASRGCPKFFGTPYYLRNGESYRFQIWPVHSEGPFVISFNKLKAHENFWRKGSMGVSRIPGTAQFFGVPPIISGTRKATDFKFSQYIQRVHPNKSPRKFLEKGSVGVSRIPGTAQFFRVPPIISGTRKATDFNFCMHIYRLNRNKSPLKIREMWPWALSGTPENFPGAHT